MHLRPINGRRVQRSAHTENRKLAEKIYAEALLKIQDGSWFELKPEPTQTARGYTFEELSDRYMTDHSIPTKAATSVERDKGSFKQLRKTFGGLHLKEITPSKIAEHKSLRRKKGVACHSI
jgi:hypothetical protein